MKRSTFSPVLGLVIVLFFAPGHVLADDPAATTPGAAHAARGDRLLEQGDLAGAARAWLEAVRAEPNNRAYADRARVLRSAERLRRFVESGDTSSRWTTAVVTLHAFYLDSNLPWKALELDKKAHARLDNRVSTILLAETLLVLEHDQEAVALLRGRREPTFHERSLLGIALLRQGKREDGIEVAASLKVPDDATPSQLQDAARLKSLAGESEAAFALLRRSFERTPTRALAAARKRVLSNVDFVAVRELPAFKAVLATPSKVPETCSGGESCGSCPNRGKCGKE